MATFGCSMPAQARSRKTFKRVLGILLVAVAGWSDGALAACSNESANVKAQEFGAIAKRKMQTKPDEMGDLAGEFGDMMAETAGKVTEQTCTKLDDMIRKANRL